MSLITTVLLPLLEPIAKQTVHAIAKELERRNDARYRKHYYASVDIEDSAGDVVERRMSDRCWYCGRRSKKHRLFTIPPCPGLK